MYILLEKGDYIGEKEKEKEITCICDCHKRMERPFLVYCYQPICECDDCLVRNILKKK
ncbi:MAG: hypothetical protein QXG39_02575 [Candidatus Aenigmatarchaeota archaeon]